MAITEKTRKIIWGRSGNRCAICRRELVIDATAVDDESVIGDECHVVSGKPHGPRYDPAYPDERLDDPGNLILLCRVHRKQVDDQCETYPIEMLQQLKTDHEKWVSSALNEGKEPSSTRLCRIKKNIPSYLIRLMSGQDILNIVSNAYGYSFEHDEPKSEMEVELLSDFLQEAKDWGELSSGLDAGERVTAAYRLSSLLQQLGDSGFWAFGAREVQRLEGGVEPPSAFPVAILRVARSTNPEIINLRFSDETESPQDLEHNFRPPEKSGA